MCKKKAKEVLRKEEVCQTCKNHRNRPSWCAVLGKFVGRKDTPADHKCDNYGWNKRKLSKMELSKDCDGSCGCSNKNQEETINA